jgi:hypothetical protein
MAYKTYSELQKGTWSSLTSYTIGDFVNYNGSQYTCIANNSNTLPTDTDYWVLVAEKGTDGSGTGDVVGPSSATNGGITLFDLTTGKLIKDSGKTIVTTLGADDTTVPTSKGVKDVTDTKIPTSYLDTDGTLAANSDSKVATQKATKTYVDGKVTVTADSTTTFTNKTLISPVINYTDTTIGMNVKCRVFLGTIQSDLIDNTATKVLYDTESYDVGNHYDTTNKRFVAPVTGYYDVTVAVSYTSASVIADKRYRALIYVNGALYSTGETQSSVSGLSLSAIAHDIVYVEAGQYIEDMLLLLLLAVILLIFMELILVLVVILI